MLYNQAEILVRTLQEQGLTITAAESLTGGRISAAITSVPGSSSVFPGSVVSYSNAVKQQVLGVSPEVLSEYGAVSEQTARQMAAGAAALMHTDLALSATGLAGPDGDGGEIPIGTVWLGLCAGDVCRCERCCFSGNRAEVQEQAAARALELAIAFLKQ